MIDVIAHERMLPSSRALYSLFLPRQDIQQVGPLVQTQEQIWEIEKEKNEFYGLLEQEQNIKRRVILLGTQIPWPLRPLTPAGLNLQTQE